jgi:hypothetical protein
MSVPSREAKVFAALLLSMSICAALLLALGKNPPSAGAFCLDDYYRLESVEKNVASQIKQFSGRWNAIEIFYNCHKSDYINTTNQENELQEHINDDYHFALCNGLNAADGIIITTEKWQIQQSAIDYTNPISNEKTIRICIIKNSNLAEPTEYQEKRLEELIEELSKRFDISLKAIYYPEKWR